MMRMVVGSCSSVPPSGDGAKRGWMYGAAATAILSRRSASIVSSRITASTYSMGVTPLSAARSAISRVRQFLAPGGRPEPGRLPPRGIALIPFDILAKCMNFRRRANELLPDASHHPGKVEQLGRDRRLARAYLALLRCPEGRVTRNIIPPAVRSAVAADTALPARRARRLNALP